MKRLLIIAFLFIPSFAGGGDYSIHRTIDTVTEVKGDKVIVTKQSAMTRRIARFALKYGVERDIALEFGEVLSKKKHPRVYAAIAARESSFNPRAIGTSGEKSAFQILNWPKGKNPRSIKVSADEAEVVLEVKKASAKGNLWKAVERYNGSGQQARNYAKDIKRLVREI